MRNKYDNILLGLLWVIASTLGITFWFNTHFGFNIFSATHWQHLAHMQAVQQPIRPMFYISMVFSVIIVLFGLYLLFRPRTHKQKYPIPHIHHSTPHAPIAPQPTPSQQHIPGPTTPAATPVAPHPVPETHLTRPPRLSISIPPTLPSTNHTAPKPATPAPTPQNNGENWPELKQIFEETGYTTKRAPRIDDLQTSLLAIGTNETLWIGAVGVTTEKLKSAIDTLTQIFTDTLDSIYIDVHGFIIAAPDSDSPIISDILTFDSMTTLRNYMKNHQNPPLPEDGAEDFDAFSEYISTVIEYLEKM